MLSFEELKAKMKEVEADLEAENAAADNTKESVSESEVSDLTEVVLDIVKMFGKTCLRTIKNSKNPFDDFMRICQTFESLPPRNGRFDKLKDSLIKFKENHKVVGTVIGILSTIISTVARFVLSGIKLLFKIVGAVLITLANLGYRIVKEIKNAVTSSKNNIQYVTFTQTFEE